MTLGLLLGLIFQKVTEGELFTGNALINEKLQFKFNCTFSDNKMQHLMNLWKVGIILIL